MADPNLPNSLRTLSRLRGRLDSDHLRRLAWTYDMRAGDYDHKPDTAARNVSGARAVRVELKRRGIVA
jgi:hypothetical protein